MQNAMSEKTSVRFGEVIEASTSTFTTQCYQLYEAPPLGGLVRCGEDSPIYGIVYEVATRSMDPGRHPVPRGESEDTEEGVYLSNPQLSRLLYTEFHSMVVGHRSNGVINRYLSPSPPRIHSFVSRCDGDELREFSESLEFLPLVLSAPISFQDDVIASFLRLASASHIQQDDFLVSAGKELAVLLGRDLQRLDNVLRRISQ